MTGFLPLFLLLFSGLGSEYLEQSSLGAKEFWQQFSVKPKTEEEHKSSIRAHSRHGATRGSAIQTIREQGEPSGLRFRREQVARIKNEVAREGTPAKLPALRAAQSGLQRQEELARVRRKVRKET